jgi:hypothetical protein
MNNGPVQQLYISIPYGQGHTHEIIYGMQVNKITNHKTRVNFFLVQILTLSRIVETVIASSSLCTVLSLSVYLSVIIVGTW